MVGGEHSHSHFLFFQRLQDMVEQCLCVMEQGLARCCADSSTASVHKVVQMMQSISCIAIQDVSMPLLFVDHAKVVADSLL